MRRGRPVTTTSSSSHILIDFEVASLKSCPLLEMLICQTSFRKIYLFTNLKFVWYNIILYVLASVPRFSRTRILRWLGRDIAVFGLPLP